MTEGWLIFFAGVILTLVIPWVWSMCTKKFYGPETRVFVQRYGRDCTVFAENIGKGSDKNIKIDLHFGYSNSIQSTNVTNEKRTILLQGGGLSSNYVVIKIDELLPGERQDVRIITKNDEPPTAKAWSEGNKTIKNIQISSLKWGSQETAGSKS